MENTSAAMLTTRSNYHGTKLPQLGEIVTVFIGRPSPYTDPPTRKWIVEAYPLCDGALYRGRHMSFGIHTVHLRALDNGYRTRVSAHWCIAID